MKVLFVNPIIYTSETKKVNPAKTIKDTMGYDLCLAFCDEGIDITLACAEDYKPTDDESYPFNVLWLKTKFKKICFPNSLPFCPEIVKIALKGNYDLIISSEVFSLNSLMLSIHSKKNLIVWHELAMHNNMLHQIPSKIWYGIIARLFFRKTKVVARSILAKEFISKYCKNTSDVIVDHGVNLDKFEYSLSKNNQFAICSQLIPRKHIEKSIDAFGEYLKKYDSSTKLYIMGDGEDRQKLEDQVSSLGISENVEFTGKLPHSELIGILRKSAAMLIYTEKDNSMISIVESIAVATPIVTNSVPFNSTYIKSNQLGIVNDCWNADDLNEIITNDKYISNCLEYRKKLSTHSRVHTFLEIQKNEL